MPRDGDIEKGPRRSFYIMSNPICYETKMKKVGRNQEGEKTLTAGEENVDRKLSWKP